MKKTKARRRAGFALADFVAGTIILAGAVTAWVAITRAQLDATRQADLRGRARSAALLALDEARLSGIEKPSGEADANGFRLVKTFPVANLPQLASREPSGRLEARRLAFDGEGDARGLVELRATVRWRAQQGDDVLEISTALGGER